MKRLGNKLFSTVLAALTSASLLAGCGGGGSRSALPATTVNAPDYNGPLADATFRITIPGPATSSAGKRRPQYVSSATKSLKFVINSSTTVSGTAATGTLGAYNARPWSTFNTGTLPNANCPASGPDFVCTVTLKLPPGTDNLTFTAYDNTGGTGNILSQQIQNFTVVAATANSFGIILDANVNVMTVNGSGSCQNGPVGASFGSVGTTPVTYTVAYTDAAGKTIVAPGLPKLQIQDNTATWQSASGTINGTGGTVGFTITQSTQTFTLTPSNSSTTNASINVRAIQPDSNITSDGLSYTKPKTFAFSTGVAPPTHNFLSAVEQTGVNTGQVDFYNVTLGGIGGPDSFSAFAPATLAVTNSTNENQPDVNNPLSLAWDSTGDLLVGNGADGGANHGDLACIPVGAIATGANTSTTITQNVTTPLSIAYDSRDGSVALSDNPVASPVELSEFLLTGNYTAAPGTGPGTRNLVAAGLGDNYVVNVPDLAAGTYAAALLNGSETDPAHGGSSANAKIAILSPTGVETDITNPTSPTAFAIDIPSGLAYDATNHQLVIANDSVWHKNVSFYSVSPVNQVKVMSTGRKNKLVAASPDGHIAVAERSSVGSGYELVQVFDNTPSRNPVGGPIPYNSTSDAGTCAVYIYGTDGAGVAAMTWLSNSKLLVAVTATSSGTPIASNGLHIYDINSLVVPAGSSDETCAAYAAAPKETGSQHLNKTPFGVAFKP